MKYEGAGCQSPGPLQMFASTSPLADGSSKVATTLLTGGQPASQELPMTDFTPTHNFPSPLVTASYEQAALNDYWLMKELCSCGEEEWESEGYHSIHVMKAFYGISDD